MSELVFDLRETYLSRIINSIGSKMFRNCFCKNHKNELIDVCQGGRFSCAVFVSNILKMHDLIRVPCANTGSLEKELKNYDWFELGENLLPGSVLFWEPRMASDGHLHRHTGFYLDEGMAISNDPRNLKKGSLRVPIWHRLDCDDILGYVRKIERAYYHPLLK